MPDNNHLPIYDAQMLLVEKVFKDRNQQLWEDLQASKAYETAYNLAIPYENWEEAERRVRFVDGVLKKYSKQFHSRIKVYAFVHNLNSRLKKLEERKAFLDSQVAMEFLDVTDEKKQIDAEIEEIHGIKNLLENSKTYFKEVYFSK